MKTLTRKSLISLFIALIMILNLVPFGAISQVYAANTYTVTFDLNGGTMTSPTTQVVNEGESPVLSEEPTKGTLSFYYWDKNGSSIWDLSTLEITEDTTLVAKWVTWMRVYPGNNGKVGSSSEINVEPTSYNTGFGGVVYEGDTNYYWAKPDDGYSFIGWINTSDNTMYSTNNPIMLKSGETPGFNVRAIFESNTKYTITFNSGKIKTTVPNPITVVSGGIFPPPEEPIAQCYDFAGWYTDLELTNLYEFGTPITENITLYAKWIAHHSGISLVPSKETTCKEAGNNTYYICNDCGRVFKDSEGTVVTTIEAETIAKLAHTWDSGKITKAATCKEAGIKTYTCTVCGETKTETIAKLAHTPTDITTTKVTKATLTKNGEIKKTIETKCKVCNESLGGKSETTPIYYPKTIELKTTSYTYDGKAKKPAVIVTDSNGKPISSSNYSVSYSSNKKVGTATATITFKGNYEVTKKLTYKINPKGVSLKKITKGRKQFKATWKKNTTQTTGYEIQYSTNKNFKSGNKKVTIKKNKTTSTTVKKLKNKKKYYVRIRTYKTVKGTKYYSGWSKVKNVKTK